MIHSKFVFVFGLLFLIGSCTFTDKELTFRNLKSFHESQIIPGNTAKINFMADSVFEKLNQASSSGMVDEIVSDTKRVLDNPTDSAWKDFLNRWEELRLGQIPLEGIFAGRLQDSTDIATDTAAMAAKVKWAQLNASLLKYTGEARFADALNSLTVYPGLSFLSESFIKSVIYLHVDDQIFINLYVPSTLSHYHTTGGEVKLIQERDPKEKNAMILRCECADTRYLDVFILIPSSAVNPTINHGNVKYVAHPGEYCQISRKWRNNDIFRIDLKN